MSQAEASAADSLSWASRAAPVLAVALMLGAVGAYAQLLFSVTANVPYLDDYDVILDFLNRYVASESAVDRFALAFSQHVEHRMAFLRALALLSHYTQGGVDFETLNLLGSLGLGVLTVLLYLAFRPGASHRGRIVLIVPVPLLLFHPQFWDCLLWPTSSLANFWVVVFALSTFLLLRRRSAIAFAAAALAATAAVFSQANGLLVPVLGAAALLLERRAKELATWVAGSALLFGCYFSGYAAPEGSRPIATLLSGWDPIAYGLNLIGSAPAFSTPGLSLALGVAGLLSFGALVWLGHPRKNAVLFSLLCFVLTSIAANALARAQLGGPEYPLHSPRYRFFSCVFWAASYLAWIDLCTTRRRTELLLGSAVAASLAFSIASFSLYRGEVERVSQRMQRGMLAWSTRERGLVHPDQRRAGAILRRAIDSGVYTIPIDRLLSLTPLEAMPAERSDSPRF